MLRLLLLILYSTVILRSKTYHIIVVVLFEPLPVMCLHSFFPGFWLANRSWCLQVISLALVSSARALDITWQPAHVVWCGQGYFKHCLCVQGIFFVFKYTCVCKEKAFVSLNSSFHNAGEKLRVFCIFIDKEKVPYLRTELLKPRNFPPTKPSLVNV